MTSNFSLITGGISTEYTTSSKVMEWGSNGRTIPFLFSLTESPCVLVIWGDDSVFSLFSLSSEIVACGLSNAADTHSMLVHVIFLFKDISMKKIMDTHG